MLAGLRQCSRVRGARALALAILFAWVFICAPLLAQVGSPADQSVILAMESELQQQNYAKVLLLSQPETRKLPADARLWTLRGMAYAGMRRDAPALASYRQALHVLPDYVPALEGAAEIEYSQGSPRASIQLKHLLALRPLDPVANGMMAVLEYRAGNCERASIYFERAKSVIASQPVALQEYSECMLREKRFDDALPLLTGVVALHPKDPIARYNLALDQWNTNAPTEALQTLQTLIDSGQPDEDVLTLAADIYESMNNTPSAAQLLRQAIVNNPRQMSAYLQFAALSSEHNSYQVGIDMLNAGLTQQPGAAQLYLARGVLFAQMGNFPSAMSDFETANTLNPTLSYVGTAEGVAETSELKFGQALEKFREQAKKYPNNALNQYLLAEALIQKSRSGQSGQNEEAIRAAQRALTIDPRLVAAHDLLARIYLQQNKNVLAAQQCRAALAEKSTDQEAIYHLILALRKTNQKNEIHDLTKRLVVLRSTDRAELSQKRHYVLTEAPRTTQAMPSTEEWSIPPKK